MTLIGRLLGRPKPRWSETWQTFPGRLDTDAAVWTVDLGAVAAAPVDDLPLRLQVEVPYQADQHGLPAEPADLAPIEDAVRADLTRLGGEYVGRIVSGGVCRLTGHLPSGAEPATVPGVTAAAVSTAYDPHWAFVRDTLAPDERQHQLLMDLAVVASLADQGDPLGVPRDVAHVAYFADEESAQQAAAELRADGFAAGVEWDGEGDFALTALRRDPVEPPDVHELTWRVRQAVEHHTGGYDGWHCEPVLVAAGGGPADGARSTA